MPNKIDYSRMIYLNQKINQGVATKAEKDEYMLALYNNGNITKEQYERYLDDKSNDEIIKGALAIGGILLVTYLLSKIID